MNGYLRMASLAAARPDGDVLVGGPHPAPSLRPFRSSQFTHKPQFGYEFAPLHLRTPLPMLCVKGEYAARSDNG